MEEEAPVAPLPDSSWQQVKSVLKYLKPIPKYDTERPHKIMGKVPKNQSRSNIEFVQCETTITDARGHEADFSLDRQGFAWTKHDLSYSIESDDDVQRYMDDMQVFLKDHFQASRVCVYDFVKRLARAPGEPRPTGQGSWVMPPNMNCHTDIASGFGEERVRQMLPQEADELLKRPFQIIGAWRPLIEPLDDHPLAMCDFESLEPGDIVTSDLVMPHHTVETGLLWYNPQQRWYYLRNQMIDEVLLIKSYDSKGPVQCVHSAFFDPKAKEDCVKRQSIELRCFVFF